jgi:hypothetical protein
MHNGSSVEIITSLQIGHIAGVEAAMVVGG